MDYRHRLLHLTKGTFSMLENLLWTFCYQYFVSYKGYFLHSGKFTVDILLSVFLTLQRALFVSYKGHFLHSGKFNVNTLLSIFRILQRALSPFWEVYCGHFAVSISYLTKGTFSILESLLWTFCCQYFVPYKGHFLHPGKFTVDILLSIFRILQRALSPFWKVYRGHLPINISYLTKGTFSILESLIVDKMSQPHKLFTKSCVRFRYHNWEWAQKCSTWRNLPAFQQYCSF